MGDNRTMQMTAALEHAVDEFRKMLPAATATAQAIDAGEPWERVALNAINDGYVDFANQLSTFLEACRDEVSERLGEEQDVTARGVAEASAQRPTGMCPVCGRVAFALEWCGQCPTQTGGEQCKGWMRSTVHDGDWSACAPCDGIGRRDGDECMHCNAVGLVFVRAGGFDGTRPSGRPIIGRLR